MFGQDRLGKSHGDGCHGHVAVAPVIHLNFIDRNANDGLPDRASFQCFLTLFEYLFGCGHVTLPVSVSKVSRSQAMWRGIDDDDEAATRLCQHAMQGLAVVDTAKDSLKLGRILKF